MRSTGHGMMLCALRTVVVRCAPLPLLVLGACEKDGATPSFTRILSPTATEADGTTVEPSAVTDFWVFASDEAIGVWQENRRIPVLEDGPTNMKIIAGVRRNGVTNDRIQYPFYSTWSQEVDLVLGEETVLQPVFRHYADPIWEEGFEDAGFKFSFDEGEVDMAFVTDPTDVLVGQKSAAIVLDTGHTEFRAVSTAAPPFPNGTDATFLEFDHKSDTRFLIGVRYTVPGQPTNTVPYVFVSPSGMAGGPQPWKHLYIDLSTAWGQGTVDRQFYIEAQLENGATNARIILDNLTVYH